MHQEHLTSPTVAQRTVQAQIRTATTKVTVSLAMAHQLRRQRRLLSLTHHHTKRTLFMALFKVPLARLVMTHAVTTIASTVSLLRMQLLTCTRRTIMASVTLAMSIIQRNHMPCARHQCHHRHISRSTISK